MGMQDLSSKRLVENNPDEWVQWIFNDPELRVIELVSEELRFVGRETDILLKVEKNGVIFIVHIEIQYRYSDKMPVRIFSYNALSREKFDLPVLSVVVYFRPPPAGTIIPTQYHVTFQNTTAHLDFHIIRLWEVDARQVLDERWDNLLPLIPMMANVDDDAVVEAYRRLHKIGDDSMQTVLKLYATIAFGKEQSARLLEIAMLFFDEMLRDSPVANELREEGHEEGLKQGLKQGLEQGVDQGLEIAIFNLIRLRFGEPSEQMETEIDDLNKLQLEKLFEYAVFAPSLESLRIYLNNLEA